MGGHPGTAFSLMNSTPTFSPKILEKCWRLLTPQLSSQTRSMNLRAFQIFQSMSPAGRGYRYVSIDPQTGERWPAMPASFSDLARTAADDAGFAGFSPDACLINRYLPGARLTLHQDINEHDFSAPIVSLSLGMSAVFLFGGHQRNMTPTPVPLVHGDVVAWGGEDRPRFHDVAPIKGSPHPLLGAQRINLTFRRQLERSVHKFTTRRPRLAGQRS
jgi:DNA alkylation damage repair protein AlkB